MPKFSAMAAGCAQFIVVLLLMGGCGGGNGSGTPPPSTCSTASTPVLPALAPPNGTVGVAYSFTSGAVAGGTPPFTISISSGTLPAGLTATPAATTVTVAGTPTVAGISMITVQVSDSCQKTATAATSITINAPLMVLPGLAPPNATINSAYVFNSLPIIGGTPPFTATLATGTLPAGLTLGVGAGNIVSITGTATTLGTSSFTINVKDSGNPQQSQTTSTITMSVVNLQVTTTFLPDATNAVTGYAATLTSSGGTAPFTWSVAPGTLPPGMNLSAGGTISGTPTATGPASFIVQVTDANNAIATAALLLNVLPELPRVFLNTALPFDPNNPPSFGFSQPAVFTGGTLSSPNTAAIPAIMALLASNPPCGTIIRLHAGDYFQGNLILPRHVPECTAALPITITTDDPNLPPPGTRVTPADAVHMARIDTIRNNNASIDFSATGAATPAACALSPAPSSCGGSFYRLIGIEVSAAGPALNTPNPATPGIPFTFDSALINVGNGESTTAMMPHDIIIDRCYIHGVANTGEIRRGVLFNGINASIIDSNVSEIHETGFDAQAVAGWNGPGPFKIVNNRLEASTENVVFGGAIGPNNGGDTVIADIEIRNNYFFKPPSWQTAGNTNTGTLWLVKNLLEFKNASRILIDGNVFENIWQSAQAGFAILLTPRGPGSAQAGPSDAVADVTIQNNLIEHAGGGVIMTAYDHGMETPGVLRGKNVVVQNNVILDINRNTLSGAVPGTPFGAGVNAPGATFEMLDGLPNVTIQHNTGFGTNTALSTSNPVPTQLPLRENTPFVMVNNMLEAGGFGVFCGTFGQGNPAFTNCFAPASALTFNHTVLINLQGGATPLNYPATNQVCDAAGDTCFPISDAAAGILDPTNCNAGTFTFTACALTKYNNAGTDGKDLGADMTKVIATTSTNPVKP